ncbi:MAG: cation:proton antiporter [Chloroflexi bacterium]|nr:cation:proton antiporter [Chloroflexota bacterium]
MENTWAVASLWMALALVASLVSIRVGLSVALAEILVGILGGNFLGLDTTPWIDFLASFGAILLTFLAGAEIDPVSFRRHFKASMVIGTSAFLFPFVGAGLFAYFVAGWDLRAAEIAGVALSTTSVAVVYAVMVETGLNETDLGKLILAACFVNDLGTVLALGILFANFNVWMALFVGLTLPTLWLLPKVAPWVIARWGRRTSEPEVKFFLLVLFVLGWLATSAGSEAVLPAYLVGLVTAGVFVQDRAMLHQMRTMAFAVLMPFYFLKAGLFVSLPAVGTGFALILALLGVKMATKVVGVWPLTRAFRMGMREGNYTTLMMSTGLTFGSISALFGLTHGIIDQAQYTVLVTVVLGSAVVPTLIAQTWFRPQVTQVGDAASANTDSVAPAASASKTVASTVSQDDPSALRQAPTQRSDASPGDR